MRIVALVIACTTALALPATAAPVGGPRCRIAEPPGAPATPPNDGIRVASLNLLHGLDDDAPGDYPGASTLTQRTRMQAEQLAGSNVDIVGLQEVSVFTNGGAATYVVEDLAEQLADVTGQRWWSCWFLANPYFPLEPDVFEGGGGPISDLEAGLVTTFTGGPYDTFKVGDAIVSRYEITATEGAHLPGRVPAEIPLCVVESLPADPAGGALCAATAGFERRSAIWARATTPDGTVDVTSTHLAHGITSASDLSALGQATAAAAFASGLSRDADHAFFVCDCNSQTTDEVPVVQTIEQLGWLNTSTTPCVEPGDPGCTAGPDVIVTHGDGPARTMDARIDFVFSRGCASDAGLIVDTAEAYTDEHGSGWLFPSDHIGVAADACDDSPY